MTIKVYASGAAERIQAEAFCRKHGWELVDSEDEAMIVLLDGAARALLAARVKAGIAARKARGERIGREPSVSSDVIGMVRDAAARGMGPTTIAKWLAEQGIVNTRGQAFSRQRIHQIIRGLR